MSSNIVLPQPGTEDFKNKFESYIQNRIKKDPEFTIECSGNEKKEFAYQKVVKWCIRPEQPYIEINNGAKEYTFRDIKFKKALINWRTGSGKTYAMISVLNNFRDSYMPIIVCFTRANERNNFLSSLININSPVGELLKIKLQNDRMKKNILGINNDGEVLMWSCSCGQNNNKNIFCKKCKQGHRNLFKHVEPVLKQICNSRISLLTYNECGGTNTYKLSPAFQINKSFKNITKNQTPEEMNKKTFKKNKFNCNFTVFICDEVHNFFNTVMYAEPQNNIRTEYLNKQKHFFKNIKDATNCYFYGFSATPIQYQLNETPEAFKKRCDSIFDFLKSGSYYQNNILKKNIKYNNNQGFMFLYHPDLHNPKSRSTFPQIISEGILDAKEIKCQLKNDDKITIRDQPTDTIKNMTVYQKYLLKLYMFNAHQKTNIKDHDFKYYNKIKKELKTSKPKKKEVKHHLEKFQLIYYKNKYINLLKKKHADTFKNLKLTKYNFKEENDFEILQQQNKIKILRTYMNTTGSINTEDDYHGISTKIFKIVEKIKENIQSNKKTLIIAPGKYYMFKNTIQALTHLLNKEDIKYTALRSNVAFFESKNKFQKIEENPSILAQAINEFLENISDNVNENLIHQVNENCVFNSLKHLDENSKIIINDDLHEDELISTDTGTDESNYEDLYDSNSDSDDDEDYNPSLAGGGNTNLNTFIKKLTTNIKQIISQSTKSNKKTLNLKNININDIINKIFENNKKKINDQDQSKYNELKKIIIRYLRLYRERENRMGSTPKERRIIVYKKMKEFNENNNYSNNDSIPRVMIINENFMEATSFLGCQSVLFISPPISYDQYLQYKGRCLRACASHIQIHFKEQQKIEFVNICIYF